MKSEDDKLYYVYELSTPEGNVFYVGKGSGNRINTHEITARSGRKSAKDEIIRQILTQGKRIRKQKVYQTNSEDDALLYEWALIHLIYGHEKLANTKTGGRGRPTRTPGGAQHVNFTLSGEIIQVLKQIQDTSEQGEPISHMVEEWMWHHPYVKAKLQEQEERKEPA